MLSSSINNAHEIYGSSNNRRLAENSISLIGLYLQNYGPHELEDPEHDFVFCCMRLKNQHCEIRSIKSNACDLAHQLSHTFNRVVTLVDPKSASSEDSRPPTEIRIETFYSPWKFSAKEPVKLLKSRETQTVKSLFNQELLNSMARNKDPHAEEEVIKEYLRKDEPNERIAARTFYCGNPNVEVVQGVLHLYKENIRVAAPLTQYAEYEDLSAVDRSDLVCILNVPLKFGCPDLLHYVAPFSDSLSYVRILSAEEEPSTIYMVLLKFKTILDADRFYTLMNGTPYTTLDQNVRCQMAYVARVEYNKRCSETSGDNNKNILPFSSVGASGSFTELPICIVCLERMDEAIDGVVTILCNHSFHSGCLARGSVITCPVCRFLATPQHNEQQTCMKCDRQKDLWICLICGSIGCGRYTDGGHALRHFELTGHTYAMNVDTQRVWDYVGDNYVHRLIQGDGSPAKPIAVGGDEAMYYGDNYNNGDGRNYDSNARMDDYYDAEKESLNLEFTYMLTRSLEEQRVYFEKKQDEFSEAMVMRISKLDQLLSETNSHNRALTLQNSDLTRERDKLEYRIGDLSEQMQALQQNSSREIVELEAARDYDRQEFETARRELEQQCVDMRKDRDLVEKRMRKLTEQLQMVTKQHSNEKQHNDILNATQKEYKEECEKLRNDLATYKLKKEAELDDVQEQLRDLMFHMQSQAKVEALDESQREEIQGGKVETPASSATNSNATGSNRRSGAKKRR